MLAASYNPTHQFRLPKPSLADTTTPRVLTIISSVLEKLVARNDRLVEALSEGLDGGGSAASTAQGKGLKAFHGVRAPNISIPKYLERIYKYTDCSPSCFVVAYVYIDRLLHKHPDSLVVSMNVHRLLVTSIMVASKMNDDLHYNNAFYARVGGVSNAEVNRLELELLFLLDFGVTVSSPVFKSYCFHLEKEMLTDGGGGGNKIERGIISPVSIDDVAEISVDEDSRNFSPPRVAD
ncbi:Cyclin-U1-1 [Hibiscus syriacus]|uniref:Cyclin-U1-1 n=1 Tax=Hibiscus syriacus TaxID=106335 RepID=A0A6A3CAW1_HIBSY|nr:cyclin-U1-1-like [Hibiscus syriacus]KAE8725707.1 Cyclin-U1-1 [Hibiscus syriacus]